MRKAKKFEGKIDLQNLFTEISNVYNISTRLIYRFQYRRQGVDNPIDLWPVDDQGRREGDDVAGRAN